MKKLSMFFVLVVLSLRLHPTECLSVSNCQVRIEQKIGEAKKSLNNTKEEVVDFSINENLTLEKIEIKAGNYGGVSRAISCRITDEFGAEILSGKSSSLFISTSGSNWREVNFSNTQATLKKDKKYQIRCKGSDSWNSIYWSYDPLMGKTFKIYACDQLVSTPTSKPIATPTSVVSPTSTPTPVLLPVVSQKVKIIHFSDIGGESPNEIFTLLKKYNGSSQTIFIGSGDYFVYLNQSSLDKLKNAVNGFISQTSFKNDDLILALGNHDDPGRVSTWMWNQTWNNSRLPEDVVIKDNLLIAWIHTENPNLTLIEEKIKQKRQECPVCVGVMVGHKPVVMEPGLEAYQNYLLPLGWRNKVISLLKDYGFKFYLTGHFEVHSTISHQGTTHNRATPARRGFEEISFDYQSGEAKNISIITRDKNFSGSNPTPLPTTPLPVSTSAPSPTPTITSVSSGCHQPCVDNSSCQSGQICARNYNVRPDGVKICLNQYCTTEPSCLCAWQK